MKRLIFILILFNLNITAGELNVPKVQVIINIAENNNRTEAWSKQSANGFITGVLFSRNKDKFIGNADVLDFNFLENFSKAYLSRKDDTTLNTKNTLDSLSYQTDDLFPNNFNDIDRILQYSFYPEKVLPGDTLLNIYCKYILYEKKKELSANKNNYDISFYEHFYTVPLNKKTSIDFIKKIFPEATTDDVFFIFDTSVQNEVRPLLNLSDNNLSMNEISASVKKRPAADSNLHLNVEYVRLNKKSDETFVRSKFKCPPETDNIFSDNESAKPFPLNIYKGSVPVPFEMYNPLKKQLFEQSMSYDRDFTYSILAIPLAVKGRTYSMELIIHREIWGGMVSYSKKIELKIGKPMLIELDCPGGQSRNNEIIDGQLLRLNFKEDFSDYVKEYFIINYADH